MRAGKPEVCTRTAKADRRRTGWSRWFVFCGCGYYEDRIDKLAAEKLAEAHNDGRSV